jgi:uncharacterized RDD family membrane protein YckC
MDRDVIAVFREVADRSAEEREVYYARRAVPAALRAEVESLLRFDGATLDTADARVAAAAYAFLQHEMHSTGALPGTRGTDVDRAPSAPPFSTGAVFGPYRIVRPLGRGGMGTVYEADEIESGRRVALKVLARLTQPSERERFEREGRLAASVNHPHCVFVFSATEIDGHPVIAMEVMQGTLADRLEAEGALAPAAAVDVALQLITGLEAAAAAGILHRDIKPSNCFVDAYGTVKIGDFGISRSLRPTQETALSTRGHRPATPAYASPEQLRGAPVDVRSDIYSVGATLYELLTGRRPFDGADLMAVLMAVANDIPVAPHQVVPGIPKGLGAIALRCLAKEPEHRFPDYPALASALEHYASAAPTPATLGRRSVAGCIDFMPLVLLSMLVSLWWGGGPWLTRTPLLVMTAVWFLYFFGFEILWRATPGKVMCGLLVVRQGGGPPPVRSLFIRASAFVLIPALALQLLMLLSPAGARFQRFGIWKEIGGTDDTVRAPTNRLETFPESVGIGGNGLNVVMLGLLFCTARRRNGYAGLHDLLSATRIAERRTRAVRRLSSTVPAESEPGTIRRLGQFAVTSNVVPGMPEGWRSGFDERLRRPVWIREVQPGTPAISAVRAGVNRATRLRWIAGRRAEHEAWDTFEAVPGMPLDRAVAEGRSWSDVRLWLLDLARECDAGSTADPAPRRRHRVWALDAGGAKLVDDPALDAPGPTPADDMPVAAFLLDVVRAARQPSPEHRGGRPPMVPPWPRRVHVFLDSLSAQPTPPPAAVIRQLEALIRQPPSTTRGWRALSLAVPILLPAAWAATVFIYSVSAMTAIASLPEDERVAAVLVRALAEDAFGRNRLSAADREWIEVGLATRYREVLRSNDLDSAPFRLLGVTRRSLDLAEERVERQLARADLGSREPSTALETSIKQAGWTSAITWHLTTEYPVQTLLSGLLSVAWFALVNALVFRGGMIRLLGLEFVTADGRRASRFRVLSRTAAAWAPVLIAAPAASHWQSYGCLLLLFAGAVVAIVSPERGTQDRVAGTWIVPR